MMAFIIFYCDRKANASLNLGRVQQAYSSTEGFSDGMNVVLSKLCSDFGHSVRLMTAAQAVLNAPVSTVCCQTYSAKKEAS